MSSTRTILLSRMYLLGISSGAVLSLIGLYRSLPFSGDFEKSFAG
jgi:hypothetical protein